MAMKAAWRTFLVLVVSAMSIALPAAVVPAASEAQAVGGCSSPFPVAGWWSSGSGPGTVRSSPGFRFPVGVESVLSRVTTFSGIAAGVTDLSIQLPGGAVTLTSPGAFLWQNGIGDLDGDGLNEVWISAGPTPTRPGIPTAAWVLSGATAAGAYDVATVGIAVPTAAAWLLPAGSNGWAGGTPDDLLLYGPGTDTTWRTFVLDGNEIMAVGPGGDATGLSPISTVGGQPGYVGPIPRLGDALLTGEAADEHDAAAGGLIWLSIPQGAMVLSSYPLPWQGFTRALATDSGTDGLYLTSSLATPYGDQIAVWRLDDPCGGFPPAAASPTAEAVAPAFTG